MARQRKENRDKIKLLVQESLKENHCLEALSNILCPLDPALLCKQIHISKCKTMDSKMKPMWIVFENADPFGQDINFIFKNGDDLRYLFYERTHLFHLFNTFFFIISDKTC